MGNFSSLSADTVSFIELTGNGYFYKVPQYQRDYSWKVEQWDDLWTDISKLKEDDKHYMGSLVMIEGETHKEFDVVDGQQRITTLTLFALAGIHCLRVLANNETKDKNEDRIKILKDRFIGSIDPGSLSYTSKLKLNAENEDFYETYLIEEKTHNNPQKLSDSNKLILEAFEYFKKKISEKFDKKDDGKAIADFLMKEVGDRLIFTRIKVADDINAYMIFETLNTRGLQLSHTDLLKNYLFSQVSGATDIKNVGVKWNEILEMVDHNHFPTFLRYYMMAVSGDYIRKTELYRIITKRFHTKKDVFRLLNDLLKYAELYEALEDPDHVYWVECSKTKAAIKELKLLGVHQHYPVVLATYFQFSKQKDEFRKLLELLVVISFRYLTIGEKNPSSLESAYTQVLKKIITEDPTRARSLFSALKDVYIGDEDFITYFSMRDRKTAGKAMQITKYILCKIEGYLRKEPIDSKVDTGTIEHILPKNAAESPKNGENLIDRLGNLLLLEKKLNKEARSSPFFDKKMIYQKSHYELPKKLLSYNEWTAEKIEERQKKLAEYAVEIWRSDLAEPVPHKGKK